MDTGLSQLKVFINQSATTLVSGTPSAIWTLFHGEPLSAKNTSQVDTSQQEVRLQKPKSKVSTVRGFRRTMDLGGLVLLLKCYVPRPEWYFHHGASCVKAWGPVTKGAGRGKTDGNSDKEC